MATDDKTRILPPSGSADVGTQLSGIYELDQRLASGGMGEVFRGHNIQTGDLVAIKIVLPEFARDQTILSLFRKEASILNHLSHDAVVRYHVFTIDPKIGRPYLAMEFVNGESLFDVMRRGPMPPADAIRLCHRLASGLGAVHEAGAIHRDLSPDNIILPGGRVDRAKIIDFGIARSARVGGETLIGGKFAGKYNYVSPEQLGLYGGEVSERSDIYSLGLVLAAALRGKPIDMSGSQYEVIEKRRAVPDLTDVDPGFQPLISAMLQPDPANRPAKMGDIARVTRDLDDEGATLPPALGLERPTAPPRAAQPEPWRPEAPTQEPSSTVAEPATSGGFVQHVRPVPKRTQQAVAPGFPTPPPSRSSSRGPLIAASLAAVVVIGAGGAYWGGLFGSQQPAGEDRAPAPALTKSQPADAVAEAPPMQTAQAAEPAVVAQPAQPAPPADTAAPVAAEPSLPVDTPAAVPPAAATTDMSTADATPAPPQIVPDAPVKPEQKEEASQKQPVVASPEPTAPAVETPPAAVQQADADMPPPFESTAGSTEVPGAQDVEPTASKPETVAAQPIPQIDPGAAKTQAPAQDSAPPAQSATADTSEAKSADRDVATETPQPSAPPATVAQPKEQPETVIALNVPKPEVPPVEALNELAQRVSWLRDYRGGDCFYASATSATDKAIEIEGFGTSVDPFMTLLGKFRTKFQMEPDVSVRLIEPAQCGVTEFLQTLGANVPEKPTLLLDRTSVPNGFPISGTLETMGGLRSSLLLVDHKGMVFNLDDRIKVQAGKGYFSIPIGLGASDQAARKTVPQLLIAVTAPDNIVATELSKPAPASVVLPKILSEVRDRGLAASATAKYFQLGG